VTRLRAAALAGAIVAAALLGVLGLRSRTGVAVEGPVLVVRSVSDGGAKRPPLRGDADERAMTLAAASMAPADRQHVLELIDFATARLEAQLSPLGTDFDDGDPVEQLRKSLQPYLAIFTAARELDRTAWANDDLEVRIATSCATAHVGAGEVCAPLRDPAGAPPPPSIVKRARFLAWAMASARILDVGSKARAQQCAQTLRVRSTEALSPIALVLLADDLALRPASEPSELQAAATRLGRAIVVSGRQPPKDLEAFARVPRPEPVAPWLGIGEGQVLVIPRLSALGRALPATCE
jgi:hypothetical protein